MHLRILLARARLGPHTHIQHFITLALGEESRVMHKFGSVCLPVRVRNSKTIAPIDLIFYTCIVVSVALR